MQRPFDWLGGISEQDMTEHVADQLVGLCGSWRDQRGSTYLVMLATETSLHVCTTRPSGYRRCTANLVRLVMKDGCARVVWGGHRYSLLHICHNSLKWQGRSEGDRYEWTRLA